MPPLMTKSHSYYILRRSCWSLTSIITVVCGSSTDTYGETNTSAHPRRLKNARDGMPTKVTWRPGVWDASPPCTPCMEFSTASLPVCWGALGAIRREINYTHYLVMSGLPSQFNTTGKHLITILGNWLDIGLNCTVCSMIRGYCTGVLSACIALQYCRCVLYRSTIQHNDYTTQSQRLLGGHWRLD